ncbi:DUF5808 domain-containing protein [Microbacterium sp.]|uniref:DUF5808 domain-containing protein n=1 Tax=Microbacterium sp. TaxID=51671 RepID=UPI003F9AEA02
MNFAAGAFHSVLAELFLLIAVFLAMPSLSRPTMPMGVSVPGDYVDEPVIHSAAKRFRIAVGGIGAASIGLAALLAVVAEDATRIAPPIVFVASTVAAFIVFRRQIVQAKHEGDWFKDAKVRLVASAATRDIARPPMHLWPYLVSYTVIAATGLVGWLSYGSFPGEIPVSWNDAGIPTDYAPKTLGLAFSGVWGSAIATTGILGLAYVVRFVPRRLHPNDTKSQARFRADQQHQIGQSLLGTVALLTTILASALSLSRWANPDQPLPLVSATAAFFICFGLVLAYQLVTYLVQMRTLRREYLDGKAFADEPDNDRYWHGGLLYLNPNDPAWFVSRRVGIGWAINFGNPAMVITLGIAILAIVAINTLPSIIR